MKSIFRRLGIFIESKHVLIVIIGIALIAPAIFGAMQLDMATGTETMISTNAQAYKDYDRFNQNFGSNVLMVMVKSDNLARLLQPDNVSAMDSIESGISDKEDTPNVIAAIGPAFFIKQEIKDQTRTPDLPTNPAELLSIVTDPETGEIKGKFKSVIPDEQHALIAITLEGGLSTDEETEVVDKVELLVKEAGFGEAENIVISGGPAIMSQMEEMMNRSMQQMLLLSIILMLVILAVIFKVRGFFAWRWLPLGVVFIAIIYAFGAMGVLSINLTMVSMSVFPIIIGLGVDYAIQFHNRYDEEARRGETVADAIIDSITHIGPTIGIAIIIACLGFGALFVSPVPMIQDFGYTLIIGVVTSYVLATFFLLSVLYWHHRNANSRANAKKPNVDPHGDNWLDRGLHRLAPWVINHPAVILPVALILSVGGLISDSHIETETDEMKFISQDIPLIQDLKDLQDVAGGLSSINVLVESNPGHVDLSDPSVLAWMKQVQDDIAADDQMDMVVKTESIADKVAAKNGGDIPASLEQAQQILEKVPGKSRANLITADHKSANIAATVGEMTGDAMVEVNEQLEGYIANNPPPDGVHATVTGETVIHNAVNDALTSGREKMTLIGIGLIFLGMLVLFKLNLIRIFMAILPVALIIGWSSGVMYIMGIKYTPLTATLGALIIGIGVEFTVLLMMRYYEERGKDEGPFEAMVTAMTRVGRAIIASGMTVIGGFGALLIAREFLIVRDFGIVTLINVFFALVSTLFVLPPLIVWIDGWWSGRRLTRSG